MAVKIAMIGCGGRNRAHFQKLKLMEDIEFVGFCDIIEDRAKAYRAEGLVTLERALRAAKELSGPAFITYEIGTEETVREVRI